MNLLEIYNKMNWTWKGKQVPLKNLHDNQLDHIKSFVTKYKSNHYGYSSEGWIKAIDYLKKQREFESVKEAHKIIIDRRQAKVNRAVNNFFDALIKA